MRSYLTVPRYAKAVTRVTTTGDFSRYVHYMHICIHGDALLWTIPSRALLPSSGSVSSQIASSISPICTESHFISFHLKYPAAKLFTMCFSHQGGQSRVHRMLIAILLYLFHRYIDETLILMYGNSLYSLIPYKFIADEHQKK